MVSQVVLLSLIILILVFVWIANPTATHLIAKGEYARQASLEKLNEVKKHEDI